MTMTPTAKLIVRMYKDHNYSVEDIVQRLRIEHKIVSEVVELYVKTDGADIS